MHPGEGPLDAPATRLDDEAALGLIPPTIWIVNRRIPLTACTTAPVQPLVGPQVAEPGQR